MLSNLGNDTIRFDFSSISDIISSPKGWAFIYKHIIKKYPWKGMEVLEPEASVRFEFRFQRISRILRNQSRMFRNYYTLHIGSSIGT